MVTSNRESPSTPPVLTDELRAEVAYFRSRGQSWDEVAKAVGGDAVQLRRTAHRDPNFPAELATARRQVEQEAEDVLLSQLRQLMASDDPKQVMWAVKLLHQHLTSKRREEARLAVEYSRAQSKHVRTEAEKTKNEKDAAEAPMVVYLSAGDRRVTDTPLQLIRDNSAKVDGKAVFWAVPVDSTKARRDPRTPEPPKARVAPEG